jgi:hypothetical protein
VQDGVAVSGELLAMRRQMLCVYYGQVEEVE